MKRTLLFLGIMVMLASCKPWDHSMMRPTQAPISPKLLTLERQVEDVNNTVYGIPKDEMEFFTKEVEQNLIDPYGDKYGYIVYKKTYSKSKVGVGYTLLHACTFCTPVLLGVPLGRPYESIELEIRILDSKNKLIGKYTGSGIGKATIALYYGYKVDDAWEKAETDAMNEAFSKIRPQIQADAEILNAKLREAGKIIQTE